jgi:hypothetical protein
MRRTSGSEDCGPDFLLGCRRDFGWNLFWRNLEHDEVTGSCDEVNDLIEGLFAEALPAIDFAHCDLP